MFKFNDDISIVKAFYDTKNAQRLFDVLIGSGIWQKDLAADSGDLKTISRKMAYVSDDGADYHYTNLLVTGAKWDAINPVLEFARDMVTAHCLTRFNSVLLNLYETGRDEIRWHSDKEEQLGDSPLIACLNLGATRTYSFRYKNINAKLEIAVEHGDLLVMHENCQKNFLHAILKDKDVQEPRISLTFRKVV